MASLKLTDGLVEAMDAGAGEAYAWDSVLPRFGVRVTSSGARIYLVQYRPKTAAAIGSKTRRISIGRHDGELWNVTKARAAARKILAAVDLGGDPFAEQKARRDTEHHARLAAQATAAELEREIERRDRENFRAVAEQYIERRAKLNRSWAETERLLRFGSKPIVSAKRPSGRTTRSATPAPGPIQAWADRHIGEIRRADVADLLDNIAQSSPSVARATFAALRPLFSWCVERDLIAVSPCDRIKAPPRPQSRDRVLADDELRVIWKAADRLGYPFGPVVKLLMLTGQRRSEVAGMSRAELDMASASWRIPAERTKNAKAHEVDLSPQAISVLESLPDSGLLLFPARGEGAVRGFSAAKRKLDTLALEVARDLELNPPASWRLHDLRRTAATGMAAMAFPPHVVERVLNHISGSQGGLVGVYQRHEYRPERKRALTAWGVQVEALVEAKELPSNIHALH